MGLVMLLYCFRPYAIWPIVVDHAAEAGFHTIETAMQTKWLSVQKIWECTLPLLGLNSYSTMWETCG